jgi:hypothetical protein
MKKVICCLSKHPKTNYMGKGKKHPLNVDYNITQPSMGSNYHGHSLRNGNVWNLSILGGLTMITSTKI